MKENLPLIYRELGVYWGKRLGTPCDDLWAVDVKSHDGMPAKAL